MFPATRDVWLVTEVVVYFSDSANFLVAAPRIHVHFVQRVLIRINFVLCSENAIYYNLESNFGSNTFVIRLTVRNLAMKEVCLLL